MDATTVVFTLSANLTFSGGLYHLIGRNMPPRSGLQLWSAAGMIFGVAYLVRATLGLWSSHPLFLLLDLAMVGSGLLFVGGLRQFVGWRAGKPATFAAMLIAYSVTLACALAIWGQVGRYALLNCTLGLLWVGLSATGGLVVWRGQQRALQTPLLLNAVLIGLLGALTVLRGITVACEGVGSMFGTLQSTIYYVYASLAVVLLALSLLWMVFLRLHGQLSELASRDALTGLLNRNGLNDAIRVHFAARNAVPATLLQVDVDHFKRINDRHGHATGDAVLCAVSTALARHVRGSDFVARVGGEEFVISCASLDPQAPTLLAERVRAAVGELVMRSADGKSDVRCTISVGLSRPFAKLADWESAWREADHALYAAKSGGRNRVIAFVPAATAAVAA